MGRSVLRSLFSVLRRGKAPPPPAALRDLDSLYVQMPGMKRGFAQWCAAYANLIPGVGPLRYARAAVNLGNWVNWSAQFIPPHVMKRISQTPIGRLLYGQNTVAYWTSVGAKIARIIQHMDFEGTLRQAHEARLAGDDAKAEALEYCVTMARHALEDGVLLTYNQQLADDYLKGGLQRLFDKYHLKYDDDRRHIPIPAKIAKRAQDYRDTLKNRLQRANAIKDPKRRMAALAAVAASPAADLPRSLFEAYWNTAGFLSEYQSMMVKLAGWAYLHHEAAAGTLPPLPADPAGNAAPQGATPVARQGAPFSVPRSPFSGGGEAASSPLASPAPAIPAGAHIRTKEEQAALRDSLIPAPPPQGTAPLPDDATPQQAFQAFENTLAGKRFITPLGETVSFNEGHFGRVTCAGNPQGSDDPAKRKGFIAGYPSAQAARQALREGKVNADQIQGYQSSRAALIPLIPDIVQHPQYILGHEGAQLFVKRYDIGNGRDILAVFRKFGNDLRPVSLYPTEIHGGKLKESRVLFAENAANLRWSAGIAETGTPPPDTTTIPQSAPFVNPLANPAPGPTPAPGNAAPQGATPVARQGAPFSVPRSPFSGGGEAASSPAYAAARRRQIALYAADRAGDPNFANKGILLGQLETFYTGFLNARMKGLSRTAARLKEAPGEFTLKALALLAPSLLAYLLYDGTLKRAVQTLFFDGQEPDEDQQATLAGNLHATLAWEQDALKNVSPYTRLNYFTTPLWMSADKSVTLTLKTPIPEEIKLLHYALTALLNRTTLDTGIPNVGLNDALAEIYGSLAPGSGDRGVAIALLDTWCAPWLSGDNPWQAYRNANQFSDDAFRARLITPMPLIKEQLIDTWNGSPLVTLSRLRRNDQYGNVPQDLQALHTLLQTPIVGPVLARFASIDANGRAQTVGQYLQIAEARKAALRIQAKDTAKTYLQTNTLPDTLKTLPSEEQLYFIDALLDAVKDQALPKSTSAETLRKALNIPFQDLRQPALRATHPNP